MNEPTLFDVRPPTRDPAGGPPRFSPPPRPAATLARPTDPGTSHLAASHAKLAATRMEHFCAILDAVIAHPGLTAQELAQVCPLTNEQIHRRIKEMEEAGLIRRPSARTCTVTGHKALAIYPTSRAIAGLRGRHENH